MRPVTIGVLIFLGLGLAASGGATAQEDDQPEGRLVSLVLLPYAGVADNPRETRLPVSPMGGMRAAAEVRIPLSGPVRLAAFLGGSGSILAVNSETGLEMDYLTTDPVANRTYDTETRKWTGGDSVVYGWGAGLSPVVGRSSFNIEGRYRRDQRFAAHLDESFEILLGFPTRIGW